MKLNVRELSIISNIVYQLPPKTIRMAGVFSRFNKKVQESAREYAPKLEELSKKMEFINGFLSQNKPKENEVKSDIFLKKEIELKELRNQLKDLHSTELDIEFSSKECKDIVKIIEFGFESQLINFNMIDDYLNLSIKLNQ